MPVVVVTVTETAGAVTSTPTNSTHSSSLSSGATAGIIIGALLGGVLLIALIFYLLRRYDQHKFTRVANPRDDVGADLQYLPSASRRRSKISTRHLQTPSISSEPLMSPASWPPIPSTSRVVSPDTPPRLDTISPGTRDSSFDLGEISQVVAPGSVPRTTMSVQQSPGSSPPSLDNTPPHTRQTSGDDVPPSPSSTTKTLFLHRMVKSRAQASQGTPLAHRLSLDLSPVRSTTLDSSDVYADVERLLAEAEHAALRDAEMAHREGEKEKAEEEVGVEEAESPESIYSQGSASVDHSGFVSDPSSRPNSTLSLPRRKSSRKQRTAAPTTELSPVVEMLDTPQVLERQAMSSPVPTVANSSLDAQVSHGTTSRPMSPVADQSVTFPLLTSANFGKGSTPGASGSISSTAGLGSSSSGRASRYPSLATSSLGQSLRSGPRSDAGTDWHHPPSGLAGLTSLQIGSLRNPHSPVEEKSEHPDVLTPTKRARLREATSSSVPEVERRNVMQGGIARIDVAL